MKLLTFEVQTVLGSVQRIGLLLIDRAGRQRIVDLNAAYAWMGLERLDRPQPKRWADFLLPTDMRLFLEMGEPALKAAREVESRFLNDLNSETTEPDCLTGAQGERVLYFPDEVTLKTPVPNPRMLRDFLAFEVHTANGFKRRNESIPESWYKMPVYYKGNPNTLIGTDTTVHWPHYTRKFDYELELACIIGREGRNISVENAGRYIAGYAIMNDFSARDIQKHEMLCRLGPAKGKDFATAVGPWLVTPDEIQNIRDLRMTARINGELWSDGNSGTSFWTFEQMIAHVSMEETLYPGDILGSGTVGFGCGFELDRWLQRGDIVTLSIDGLGELTNTVEPLS